MYPDKRVAELTARVDHLQHQIDHSYKPGFGDIMIGIQMHHAKLWFAGSNANWKLAKFQVHEIEEAIEDIEHYHSDRPESRSISVLGKSVESVEEAITAQNVTHFESSFRNLTGTCNTCHRANQVEFNVIQIPDAPPFQNQRFQKEELTAAE
jgi:hypothetical protein